MFIKKLIILLLILFVPLTIASPFTINNSNMNVSLIKGISKTMNLQITNPNNYTLYDIIAEGEMVITTSTITKLDPSSNSSLSITLLTNKKGEFDSSVKIVGFTRLNCSVIESQTYDINITPGGTNPRDLKICKNDNIKFVNFYGSSVYLDIDDLNLYQGISNGNSHVQGFSTNGLVIYKIEPLIDMGYINVGEEFSNIHNSVDDGLLNLHIKSTLEETTITSNFIKTNFSMNYAETKSSYVVITNTGNKIAEQIVLKGDWFSFDKNNFTLEPGEDKAINFIIYPRINQTSDTNKNYNKTILISGDNINSINQSINIFIEYSDVAGGNISSPEWWIKRKTFCDAYPTAPDCLTEPSVVYRDKKIYDAPPILMNMSPADVKKYMDEVNGLRNEWATYSNLWKQDSDVMKDGISESSRTANESLSAEIKNTKDFSDFKNVFYILFGTFIFFILFGLVGFILYKYYLRNISIREGKL